VAGVELTVRGTLGENPSRFTEVHLHVDAHCDDASALAKLVAMARRGCLVANTLHAAVTLTVTSAAVAPA
jgi:putative redox protein